MRKIGSNFKTPFKICCALLILGVVFVLVDWKVTWRILLQVKPGVLFVAFSMIPLGFFLSAAKWQVLLEAHKIKVPYSQLCRFYYIGLFVSNFLPSNVGGDVARVALLRQKGNLSEVAASTVMERGTGFFIVLLLTATALLSRPSYFDHYGILQLLWGSLGFFLGVIFACWVFGASFVSIIDKLSNFLGNRFSKAFEKISLFVRAILFYKNEKYVLTVSIVLSLLFNAIPILFQYLLFLALGERLPLLEFVFIAPVIALISFLPISFNSWGVSEGAFVFFYTQIGVQPEQALAAALLRRVIHIGVSLVGGAFLLKKNKQE